MVTVSEAALVGLLLLLAVTVVAIRYSKELRARPDATPRERHFIYYTYVIAAMGALGLVTQL